MTINSEKYLISQGLNTEFLQSFYRVSKEAESKSLLKWLSGWHVLVCLGVVFRKYIANGLQFIKDFIGGVVLGCGSECTNI
jgi:hypothetical protein